jgi:hypothetical protein
MKWKRQVGSFCYRCVSPSPLGWRSLKLQTQTFRQTGNLAGGSATVTGAAYQANVYISPAQVQNNGPEIYWVYWTNTIYGGAVPPPVCVNPTDPPLLPPDMVSTTAAGFVPSSAIQRLPSGGLAVDLDLTKVQNPYIGSQRCVGGVCGFVPPPATFPVKGTFTPLTSGIGVSSSSWNGNRSFAFIDPICHVTNSYSGNQADTAARFTGQIGAIAVPAVTVGSNAQLHVQKGQWTQTSTCTPPPPPPM